MIFILATLTTPKFIASASLLPWTPEWRIKYLFDNCTWNKIQMPFSPCSLWDSEIYMRRFIGEYIWDQYLWWLRLKEATLKSGRCWTVDAVTTEASADPTVSSGAEPSQLFQLRQERSVPLHEVIIGCRLPPERRVTLGKAASSYQEQFLGRTQLWTLSIQHSWQLREWVSLPEGRPGWHSTASTITTQYLVASHSHHFPSFMQLNFFPQGIYYVFYLFVCWLFPTRI